MQKQPSDAALGAPDRGEAPLRLVVMGVSGAGKSTVGRALADHLGVAFRDGDDFHSPENIAKMRAGQPLTDQDRWGWLGLIAQALHQDAPLVVAASALRSSYRDHICAGAGGPVRFVHLSGPAHLIAARMSGRAGHFMPAQLLESQFQTLEIPPPDAALAVPITLSVSEQVAMIAQSLAAP